MSMETRSRAACESNVSEDRSEVMLGDVVLESNSNGTLPGGRFEKLFAKG
jgi:hypothetical protein